MRADVTGSAGDENVSQAFRVYPAWHSEDVKCLVIVLLFALPSAAADQPMAAHQIAEQLLGSANLRDKAWGAYWAGRLHADALNQLLVQSLSEAQPCFASSFNTQEHAYVLALFDALIESGTKVPISVIAPFRKHWKDDVLILAARDRGENEDLLLTMREEDLKQAEWLATGNLLLAAKSSKFFVNTLREIHITHTFRVIDPMGVPPRSHLQHSNRLFVQVDRFFVALLIEAEHREIV